MSACQEFIDEINYADGRNKLCQAEDEWESVPDVIPGSDDGTKCMDRGVGKAIRVDDFIPFNEALQYFQTKDMQEYLLKSQPTLQWGRISHILRYVYGPPALQQSLVHERNLIFAVAACPLQTTENVQIQVLQTIYRKLCNSRISVPVYGRHWEDIGFQGSDPSTDLRGVGLWGLMNLLYILMCPDTFPLARSIYRLSQHEIQHFPFAVMSINITAIVLKVLREERLNAICNKRQQVVAVVNDMYSAVFRYMYLKWKNEHRTISHSGHLLQEVEMYARKHPKRLLHELEVSFSEGNLEYGSNPTYQTKYQSSSNSEFSLISELSSDCKLYVK